MIKVTLLLPVLFMLIHPTISAQEKDGLVSGYVIDSESGLSLSNVHILNTNTKKGTISNKLGYFEIESTSTDSLRFSYISYTSTQICCSELTRYTKLSLESLELDEVVLKAQTWQQFKLEFVQKKWPKEQSYEIKIAGVKQYKGAPKHYKPTLVNSITNPLSFTHYLLNKKSRQNRRTKRYQKTLSKSYLIED